VVACVCLDICQSLLSGPLLYPLRGKDFLAQSSSSTNHRDHVKVFVSSQRVKYLGRRESILETRGLEVHLDQKMIHFVQSTSLLGFTLISWQRLHLRLAG
jgi:hypothetical protein